MANIKRNDPCPCGSGKKYKNCCFQKDFIKVKSEKIAARLTLDDGSVIIRKVRSIDALPTHNKNGISPDITPEQIMDLCLDEIYKILAKEKVSMVTDMADIVVLEMDLIPIFTYQQIAERMLNNGRFELVHQQICALKGSDPAELMVDKLENYKRENAKFKDQQK